MKSPARRILGASGLLLMLAVGVRAQVPGHTGIVISEVHHPAAGGTPVPYIEILCREVNAPAQPITALTIQVSTPFGSTGLVSIPTSIIHASQPRPAGTGRTGGGLVITPQPLGLPPGPGGVSTELVFPGLPLAALQAGAPGVPTRVCIGGLLASGPFFDEIVIGAPVGPTCFPGSGFNASIPVNATGHVNRVLATKSLTTYDYETVTLTGSPGLVNPNYGHVNGFEWTSPQIPLSPASSGPLGFAPVALAAVLVPNHPEFGPSITDPIYDFTLLNGQPTAAGGTIMGLDPFLTMASATPHNWALTATNPQTPGTPGTLFVPMGSMTQQGADFTLSALNGGQPRIARFLSDLLLDSTAVVAGNPSEVQVDVVPASTGGGDIWCVLILYDGGGNAYKAMVRNWPPNPTSCTAGPVLGASTDGLGSLDLVAICFNPAQELFVLPSLNPSTPIGSGPFFGINPDGISFAFLFSPLGAQPAHVTTNLEGIYFFQIGTPSVLAGLGTVDLVAIEYSPLFGFVQASNVRQITF